MITLSKYLLSASVIAGLAACSSGGGGNDAPQRNALNFGTTDANASANGLDFADATSTVTDVNGQTVTVRMVRHVTDAQTGQAVLQITNETISIEDIDEQTLTATIGGETIAFVDGAGTRLDGSDINVDEYLAGDFSQINSLFGYPDEGEQTEGVFAIGFETNPEIIQALAGQATYTGAIQGFGTEISNNGESFVEEAFFEGDVEIVADFGTQLISGSTSIVLQNSDTAFDFDIAETAITGNGFGTDLTLVSCSDGFTCSSNSDIGGVFFGPNGQELSGIAGLDLSATDGDGNTLDYIGAGGFVTEQGDG